MNNIRVAVGDDHIYAAEGLEKIISEAKDMECVGCTTELLEVPAMVRQKLPDVLVLDIAWLGDKMAGIHILPDLRAIHPELKVVMITVYNELLEPAIQAGAYALSKGFSKHELLDMVRWAAYQTKSAPIVTPETIGLASLTPSEQEVMERVAAGKSDKEIAQELKRSEGTIKKHVSNVLRKLNSPNRTKAAITVSRYHLIKDRTHTRDEET